MQTLSQSPASGSGVASGTDRKLSGAGAGSRLESNARNMCVLSVHVLGCSAMSQGILWEFLAFCGCVAMTLLECACVCNTHA